MGEISGEMKSLCEDIVKTYQERIKATQALKKEAGTIRKGTRKFLGETKLLHKEMAEDLRKGLLEQREGLKKKIDSLRKDFRKKEKEICSDLAEASEIWNKMKEALRSKRSQAKASKAKERG